MNTKAKILMPYLSFCLMTLSVTLMLNCGKDKNENPPPPSPVYSNATLTGTWMMKLNTGVDIVSNGLKFDGNGNIVEMEVADNPQSPSTFPSPYAVQSNGAFTLTWTFSSAPTMTFTGTLTSATAGSVTAVDGIPVVSGTLKKVMDLGACQGTWSGTLAGAFSDSFTIDVDNTGTITGGSGFTAPYIGKLFCESGDATGSLGTGSSPPMDWIKFQTGTVVSGATATISGNYETNSGNGTYTLAKVDNSRASGTYSFVLMNGVMDVMIGTATFNGAGSGTYVVTSPTTTSGTFTYVAGVDNSLIIDGTSVGSLRNGGSFFTVVDTLAGEEQIMFGVKHSALVTDVSTTFIAGQFSYDANNRITGMAEANIVQINTATPSLGNGTFSALAGYITGTGTFTYTFDPTKGTISLPTPTTDGAITSDRQLMILGEGETVLTSDIVGLVGLKQPGIAMSNASLNGTYLLYNIADENAGGVPFYVMARARMTFDGAGNGTFTELAKSSGTLVTKPSITYAVDANGGFSINGNGAKELGTVLEDGSVLIIVYFAPGDTYASLGIGIKQ